MSLPKYPSYRESAVPWMGHIPSDWESLPLGKVTLQRCDGPFGSGLKSEHYRDDGVRVVRLQNITRAGFDGSDAAYIDPGYCDTELGGHDVQAGDVLIAGLGDDRNTVGRACVAPGEIGRAIVKADCFRFRLDPGRTIPGFVALQLTAGSEFDAGLLSSGSTRSRIPLSVMATRRIALPSMSEQAHILAFLDHETAKIDALVAEQERLIALLKEMRQAVISHAVTKGLDPNVPMKDSGVEWPAPIPAHWQVLTLNRVVSQFVDYRGATPTKVDDGIPLITAVQIKDGRIDHSLDPVFISQEEYSSRMTRGFPERGDVLLTTEAPLGEVAQIDDPTVAPGQRMVLLKVDHTRILNRYLFFHFRSDFGRHQLLMRGSGSTATGIRSDRLKASTVLVPPLAEQAAIARFVDETLARFSGLDGALAAQVALLRERRAALISAAVTGKIDVRECILPKCVAVA